MRDELAKIEWLKARLALRGDAPGVVVGVGDDAAVLDFGSRHTIATVDAQVENVHFRRGMIAPRELGYRAMVAATSDVWAMGGRAHSAMVALSLPPELSEASFNELIEGLVDGAAAAGARIVGGNLSEAKLLTVTTSALGVTDGRPITRAGAQPGDRIYVTGTLGAAAVGLRILEAERADLEHAARFVKHWKTPPINADAALRIAGVATAMVDVSDGCAQDLQHLCDASGVGATLHANRLPTEPGHDATCTTLGIDPASIALTGGEDYELLFTAPASDEAAALGAEVGEVVQGREVRAVDAAGAPIDVRAGFRHFS